MLHLYDKEKNKIRGLENYKDYHVDSEIKGNQELFFLYPQKQCEGIEYEGYIRTKDNEYVIKEISDSGDYKAIKAILNLEDLEKKEWETFETIEQDIGDCLNLALVDSGWTVAFHDHFDRKRTVRATNKTTLEVVREVRNVYRAEFQFDAINKIIHLFETNSIGYNRGDYFAEDLNLKRLDVQGNSYDFYTRIYAIGATSTDADGNQTTLKTIVENHQYSSKIKTLIWKDERYTKMESLTADATAKLEGLSKPYISYNADIIDLARMSDTYKNILDYSIGDRVTLLAKSKNIKEVQRIVKTVVYPLEPHRNSCVLANSTISFEDLQQDNYDTAATVKNITASDGTISAKAINGIVDTISIKFASIQELQATKARIGTIESTYITTTQLKAVNATIDNMLVQVGKIKDLEAQTAKIKDLEVQVGKIDHLETEVGKIKDLESAYAKIKNIEVEVGKIKNLESKVAEIDDLKAGFAKIGDLEAEVGKINTLINGNLTSTNIHSLILTADKVTVANGFIKNAMIDNLDVSKINAGTINTNKFTISSADGGICIVGATQQFRDKKGNVRLQLGQDAKGDFNFILRGEDGTSTLIDNTGIKPGAIANDLIKSDMIAKDAITSKQIDYKDFVSGYNSSTNTSYMKSSKILFDKENQTLDVAFEDMASTIDKTKEITQNNTMSLKIEKDRINALISNTTIVKDGETILLKDAYNSTKMTVDSYSNVIGEHTSKLDKVTGQILEFSDKQNELIRTLDETVLRVSSIQGEGAKDLITNGNFADGKNNWDIDYLSSSSVEEIGGKKWLRNNISNTVTQTFGELKQDMDYNFSCKCAAANSSTPLKVMVTIYGVKNNSTTQIYMANTYNRKYGTTSNPYTFAETINSKTDLSIYTSFKIKVECWVWQDNNDSFESNTWITDVKLFRPAQGNYASVSSVSELKIKADRIESTVTQNKREADGSISTISSQITQLADSITSKVGSADVKSIIKQSSTELAIGFNNISKRFSFKNDGFRIYNNAGNTVFYPDSTGNMIFTGELNPNSGKVNLFGNDCRIDGTANAIRMQLNPSTYVAMDSAGYLRIFNQHSVMGSEYISLGYDASNHTSLYNTRTRLKLLGQDEAVVQARNAGDNAYVPIAGGEYRQASSVEFKTNIEDIDADTCTNIVRNNSVKLYNLKEDIKTKIENVGLENKVALEDIEYSGADACVNKKLGLILEDLTEDADKLLRPHDTDTLDLYSMVSVLWKVVQEQQRLLESLQK